jgi:predicted membrane protein
MPENDPNRPNQYDDLGRRIQDHVHEEIKTRLDERQDRWRARMERREARRAKRGGMGGGLGVHGSSGGMVVGLILAGIGAVLLLENLNIIPDRDLWDFWPVILIVAGTSRAASAYSVTGRVWGGIVAGAGCLFLAATLGFIHHELWRLFWPAVLIIAGGGMLVRALERNHYLDQWRAGGGTARAGQGAPPSVESSADPRAANMVHEFAIFGGGHRRIDSQDFQGGTAVAIFGGVQLDLRKAEMKLPEVNVDITAAFGGVEIKVPETWAVSMRVTSVFGGYDDKTHAPPAGTTPSPLLVVTGATIFGGLSVKN